MNHIAIFTAFIAGFFALVGSLLGAALTRRADYEKWLRQARTEAFATLVVEFYEARNRASIAYYDDNDEEPDRSIYIRSILTGLERHVSLARLFMSSGGREQLSPLLFKLCETYKSTGDPTDHELRNKDTLLRFQELLEAELEYLPPLRTYWPFSLVRRFACGR